MLSGPTGLLYCDCGVNDNVGHIMEHCHLMSSCFILFVLFRRRPRLEPERFVENDLSSRLP